jgi:hypothetical protein
MDTTGKQQAGRNARQRIGLAIFAVVLVVVVLAKFFYNGWLDPRTSLELDGDRPWSSLPSAVGVNARW